jgi:hypothetical protein
MKRISYRSENKRRSQEVGAKIHDNENVQVVSMALKPGKV